MPVQNLLLITTTGVCICIPTPGSFITGSSASVKGDARPLYDGSAGAVGAACVCSGHFALVSLEAMVASPPISRFLLRILDRLRALDGRGGGVEVSHLDVAAGGVVCGQGALVTAKDP